MSKTGRLSTVLRYYLPIAGAFLLVVVLVLFGIAKSYLSSSAAAAKVSNRLEGALGMPVSIGKADIGVSGGSALTGVAGYEADGSQPDKPWVTAETIDADVAAVDLLGDARPKEVTLTGLRVLLRFDKDGNLLTRLPHPLAAQGEAFPKVHVQQGQLTIDQAGRTPMIVTGFTGDVTAQGNQLTLTGTVDDPYWQRWAVTATADRDTGAVVLRLTTPRARVTQEALERLPFVHPAVWQNVQADGVTPVDFTLRFNTNARGVKYRVEAEPVDTRVTVPVISLDADQASGRVVVEDALVELRDVKGRFVDGDIKLPAADLDFRRRPTVMKFDVAVKDLQVQDLRERWTMLQKQVPKEFKGKLTGDAKLTVTVRDGRPHTEGAGKGVVHAIFWDHAVPFPLHLDADEDGFHLSRPPEASRLPLPPSPPTALPQGPPSAQPGAE
jgi:hypothetical protein